jgi:endonuclease/exonuclease/phosphatase family metal-dependent hydrolase
LLSLVCILIGWNTLNNNIGLRLSVKKIEHRDSNVFRVMTYNVHSFKKYGSNNDISTVQDILEIIKHQQPDIIGFEEFFTRKKGPYALVDSVRKTLNTKNEYFVSFIPDAGVDSYESFGMALYAKYPIVNKGIIWLNERRNLNQCIYIDVKKNNRIFRVYAIHLQSISLERQDYKSIVVASKQGKADMHSLRRIGGKLKHAFLNRSQQVALFKQQIAGCPYPYIVMGDFNDTPSSYALSQMSKGLKNAFREKGSGLGRTYNGDVPNYQIDYILTSQEFDVLTYGVIRKKASDHYPVYSDLRLR